MRYPFTKQIVEINSNGLPAGFDYLVFVNGLFKDMNNQQLDMIHAAMGISGEAGEILELVKKNFAYGKVIDVETLAKELGTCCSISRPCVLLLGLIQKLLLK